jgi:hypothetical protein
MVRTVRILLLVAMVVLLCNLWSPVCQAWSLWPFGDSKAAQPKPKPPALKPAKKPQPTTWGNFCNKLGQTVGMKKPATPKPEVAIPRPMVTQQKTPQKSSWFGSLFKPKEPDPPQKVADWIKNPRPQLP